MCNVSGDLWCHHEASTLVLNKEQANLDKYTMLYLGSDKGLSVTKTSTIDKSNFIPLQKDNKYFEQIIQKGNYIWGNITLKNDLKHINQWIVSDTVSGFRHVELYELKNNELTKLLNTKNKKSFLIKINFGETKTIYFKIFDLMLKVHFKIETNSAFHNQNSYNLLYYGIFSGIILIMAFYNTFLYFSFKHISYIYYILFIIFYLLLPFV